jgi:hypothetical protein
MKRDQTEIISVILPCAGEGKRLGFSGSKELYSIKDGLKLIDFSLEHIVASDIPCRVLVVIRKGKEEVFKYVSEKLESSRVEVICVDAGAANKEWVGSVFSGQEHFSKKNLVLLPDSFLSLSQSDRLRSESGKPLLEIVNEGLNTNDFFLGVVKCMDHGRLGSLGAVYIDQRDCIIDFMDKPQHPDRFNAFWGCFGFKDSITTELGSFLAQSVAQQQCDFSKQSFAPAGCFGLHLYEDLGTVDSVARFKKRFP